MRADNVLTRMAAVAAAAAVIALAATPASAQAPSRHGPARVTVHKRSYLDPGTETKRRQEHDTDYIYSPIHGMAPMRNSTLFMNGPALPFFHDRMPFPNCLDLSGFCR